MNQPAPSGGNQPSGMPSWTDNLMKRGTQSGPGGVALADFTDRAIAYIIDAIILGIIGFIVAAVMTGILGDNSVSVLGVTVPTAVKYPSLVSSIATLIVQLIVSAVYFVGMWTRMNGATVGQRVMKLTVRDASSGGMITQPQAITRWLYLGAPLAFSAIYGWGIGLILSLLAFVYFLYLVYTTASSATRQGFHDVQAKTVVAKG